VNVHAPLALRAPVAVEIRVRGRVQGVGFRPTVYRIARELGLSGEVLNDSEGVLIRIAGDADAIAVLQQRLAREAPPLARIADIAQSSTRGHAPLSAGFRIAASAHGAVCTEICPDAALCADCAAEVIDPFQRRFRYAFANCTHCGPRLSIVTGIPYDRAATAMAAFPLCADCRAEYDNPADRRFHAEAIACHVCGPKARLIRLDGRATSFDRHSMLDDTDAVATLLQKGEIVAIKGLGGYQLACDATNAETVARLRARKQRDAKPFALMARDLAIIRRYATPNEPELRALQSREAPIVLMRADGPQRLPDAVAPGLDLLGFMLPTTPLHLLALRRMDRPVVMTSGNLSDAPQLIDDEAARTGLAGIADYALVHDRRIVARLDDSVVRVMGGEMRVLRRGRGFAPAPIALPAGLAGVPPLIAYGGELKAAFCLVRDGQAILSQHIGDLEDAETFDDYRGAMASYEALLEHAPAALVADRHPEYLSSKLARERAAAGMLPLIEVAHHHAHVAACLADNGRALDAPPVLGIVLDGLGYGDDGALWGGEFLLADYRHCERLGTFKPVAMPGGAQAAREPWRNLYAHLMAEMGWPHLAMNFSELALVRDLAARPRATLDAMVRTGTNAPLASSCGRLFDAVAAALGVAPERQSYEGEAAARLEALVDPRTLEHEDDALAYPFAVPLLRAGGLPYVEPLAMWHALLGDLILATPAPVMAARFHKGLAKVLVAMTRKLAGDGRFDTVALSGGCFQNAVLLTQVARRLSEAGFIVLSHSRVPMNDGGLALGQAAIAAAQLAAKA
jgi:hydrogenase maturation protein HypF